MDSLKFFAIIFVVFSISEIQCQDLKPYKSTSNVTYFINSSPTFTWYDAYIECCSRDLMLLTFNTKEKLADVNSALPITAPLWTGGLGDNKQFAWISTGTAFIPSMLCPAEATADPPVGGIPTDTGNCVQTTSTCLKNVLCEGKLGFVCEENVQPKQCCETESSVLNIMQNNTCKNIV